MIKLASKDDFAKAAAAVKGGHATPQQTALNDRAAKQAGSMGNAARDARK